MSETDQAFVDGELRLALYYTGLRDKIAALNVAVVGFSFTVYDKISDLKLEFFVFLLALGFFSFMASLRSSIAYNYHFRNYEDYLSEAVTQPRPVKAIFEANRAKYNNEKGKFAMLTFGATYVPTHLFWSIAIGLICPLVAVSVYRPW